MSTQTLKDSHYRTIGCIETRSDGQQVGKDAHYRICGYYDLKRTRRKMHTTELLAKATFSHRLSRAHESAGCPALHRNAVLR